jgi:hypothetical protein
MQLGYRIVPQQEPSMRPALIGAGNEFDGGTLTNVNALQ